MSVTQIKAREISPFFVTNKQNPLNNKNVTKQPKALIFNAFNIGTNPT